ncbi:pyridoxal-phosphate dependent enzyme [Hymenobacter sp. ASUV-10]|uniref:Pyridoxal-phosphate dependent enzyme n=1 Tax=Hymenobacter aranciens TaxID=3063996 RepID=A0ABT9B8Q6_9BACT|nr:pyridoxal-phosphate dependent enzyme [Hymenobacter sp. ASUV-10]MDO7873101.1 pyridoxal-phosphate dependent enzyme [Hymenobacter sp. ASUV-10]
MSQFQEILTPYPSRLLLWHDDNKARKLKYNLQAARQQRHDTLLTFGGAYSNHIAAVAAAGRQHGLRTIGLIRGEATQPLNPTLAQAVADGMQLHYLDRASYRRRAEPDFQAELLQQHGPAYLLPEGGTNALALPGCAELVADIRQQIPDFDVLAVPAGTGGTLAGLLCGLGEQQQALGVAALKNGGFLRGEVDALTQQAVGQKLENYTIETGYHFGGYARHSADLLAFIREFQAQHSVLLDPVYTSKMLFGVLDLIRQGRWAAGSTVVAIHTGGLQGWAGWRERFDQ